MKAKIMLGLAGLLGTTEALKQRDMSPPSVEQTLLDISLDNNQQLLSHVQDKVDRAETLLQVTKMEPTCDEGCQQRCDAEADKMIREVKNPLHDITWNCKNNYNVYTTDYDPKHSHFDRISGDVMEVQRIMNQIQRLEQKAKQPWNWTQDIRETDG